MSDTGIRLLLWQDGIFSYAFNVGDFGEQGEGYQHTIIFNTVVIKDTVCGGCAGDVVYNVTHNYMDVNSRDGVSSTLSHDLYWSLCPCVKIGGRSEWWEQSDRDMNMAAVGMNIFPSSNFVVRPECRWQWADNEEDRNFFEQQYGIPSDSDGEPIFGIDGILTY